jgi:hypothetical protein
LVYTFLGLFSYSPEKKQSVHKNVGILIIMIKRRNWKR